jgi:hypothetical protein
MTMCAEQMPRQNADGDPCPPWCITDHSLRFSSVHVSPAADAGHAWVAAVRNAEGFHVAIDGHEGSTWADLTLSPQDAEKLAALTAMAGSSDLADAIRKAVAIIKEADHDRPA